MTRAGDRPRVVFDCNVLVQAAGNGEGPSGVALRLLEENRIEVFVSRAVLRELRAVLNYPSVRQKLRKLDDDRVEAFIQRLAFRATLLRHVPHVFDYPRAHQDRRMLTSLSRAALITWLHGTKTCSVWPRIIPSWASSSGSSYRGSIL